MSCSRCRWQENHRVLLDLEVLKQLERGCSSGWCFCTGGSTTSRMETHVPVSVGGVSGDFGSPFPVVVGRRTPLCSCSDVGAEVAAHRSSLCSEVLGLLHIHEDALPPPNSPDVAPALVIVGRHCSDRCRRNSHGLQQPEVRVQKSKLHFLWEGFSQIKLSPAIV